MVSENDWTETDKPDPKDKIDCHMHGDDPSTTDVEDDVNTHTYIPKDACKKARQG